MTRTFLDLGVEEGLAARLAELGVAEPAPVQRLTVPLTLAGADVVAQAHPESTTLAFALPLLQRLQPGGARPRGLVVAPTRERCAQVADDLAELAEPVGTAVLAVYGGVPLGPQEHALSGRRVDVVVGTPGRLLDHLQRGSLDLDDLKLVVIDQADRLLDLGFTPDVDELITRCPAERQTLLFTATLQEEVAALSRRALRHPIAVRADQDEWQVTLEVSQHFFLVHRLDKPRILARVLQTPDVHPAAVFVRTERGADRLVEDLRLLGVEATAIHARPHRSARDHDRDRSHAAEATALVVTEAAARGLDLGAVTGVINYDCPADETVYLHRLGRVRTGGAVITLVGFHEVERLRLIRAALGMPEETVEEVYSTSDLLTERFRLPATTPWDHLAAPQPGPSTEVAAEGGVGTPLLSPTRPPPGPPRRAVEGRRRRARSARSLSTDGHGAGQEAAGGARSGAGATDHEALRDGLLARDPASRPTPPGAAARGAGRPTLNRRLNVEHLP